MSTLPVEGASLSVLDSECTIDELKHALQGEPRYRLSHAEVYVAPSGYHFTKYLDPYEEVDLELEPTHLTEEDIAYLEKSLQSNPKRLEHQVDLVQRQFSESYIEVLDIGCGGGLFLATMKNEGALVKGLEPDNKRAYYVSQKYGLDVVRYPIESEYWQAGYRDTFDAVTLWDVIEHVNYPLQTLQSVANVLKPGGCLFIDTPCRDGLYHRIGEFTYWLTNGRYPTFLNVMYSSHPFGHKQIFSTTEMKTVLEQADFELFEMKRFHELTFPYRFYLKKIFRSDGLVAFLLPLVHFFFLLFHIKNKMVVVAKKR